VRHDGLSFNLHQETADGELFNPFEHDLLIMEV